MLSSNVFEAFGGIVEGFVPCGGNKYTAASNHGCAQALWTVDELEAPASTVTQPAIVDLVVRA